MKTCLSRHFSSSSSPAPSNHLRLARALAIIALPSVSASLSFSSSPPFIHYSRSETHALQRRDIPEYGFYDPHLLDNGHMLTEIPVTYPMGLGEPLNVIISARSDPAVLQDREDQGGLRNYFLSLQFSGECLGQSLGTEQAANLGDGNGSRNETAVMRHNYGDPYLGSCKETIEGGNHFRYWTQNGKDANSGAIFMAASVELPIAQGHDIIRNGYNLARDWIVANATHANFANPNPLSVYTPDPAVVSASSVSIESVSSIQAIQATSTLTNVTVTDSLGAVMVMTSTITPTLTTPAATPTQSITLNRSGGTGEIRAVNGGIFVGNTAYNGWTYETTAIYMTGLLGNSSVGVNHPVTVEEDGRPAMDGLVAVLTVKVVGQPEGCVKILFWCF
ncbi:hypothetical protein FRC03_002361 [Tulasnella sp. 419]|nr:hypothetical protein FRC03_002361 [Tulasnella sp. 419]